VLGSIFRIALLRYLPRRLLPVLAVWEIVRLATGGRRRRGFDRRPDNSWPGRNAPTIRPRARTVSRR